MRGTCKLCGCTDTDCSRCIIRAGRPCSWADRYHDLCTTCVQLGAPRPAAPTRRGFTIAASPAK